MLTATIEVLVRNLGIRRVYLHTWRTGNDLKDQRGNARFGGVTKVIKLFERAEELGLKSQRMSLWLAKAYERTKQKKQSVTRYLALGRESLAAGNVEQGVTFYRRILEMNPEDHEAHQNLIAALLKQGEVADAITELVTLATVLRGVGKIEQRALKIIREVRHSNLVTAHGAWQNDDFS